MTIYLVRHAHAGVRSFGHDDLARPLDDVGWGQAHAIGVRLEHAGIERLLSSAATRCVDTLAPLSRAIGLTVEPHPALMEGQSADAALALVDQLAHEGRDAALCSHGDIIPDILNRLERRGVPLRGSRCAKGSIWELAVVDGAVTDAGYEALAVG